MVEKKVLIVANYLGFVWFLLNDITILQRKGFNIHYAALDPKADNDPTYTVLKDRNITFFDVGFDGKNPLSNTNIGAYKKLKELLADNSYELIHCHTPIVGLLARVAARKYRKKGTKVIYTTHGLTFNHLSPFRRKFIFKNIESFATHFSDAIVTINREDYDCMSKMSCKNVYYINGVGVDCDNYINVNIDRQQYRADLGVDNDKIMILSVGELSVRKNHQVIIKAIALQQNKAQYIYVICGRSVGAVGTQDQLSALASSLGVNLKFLGFRGDIPQIMHCSDIGAIPSISEGLGLAGVQSLSAGIPLLGVDVQGIRDYVIDNKTGFKCNPHDAIAFAKAIEKLSNKELRLEMREQCIRIARQFDTSISYHQMECVYQNVLGY